MTFDAKTYRVTQKGNFGRNALIAGGIGLALAAVGYVVDTPHFFYAYLMAFTFWMTLALGALFFVMLHHLVGATWSVVVRRLAESLMSTIPYLAILFIPLLFGIHNLYSWSHPEAVADVAVAKKLGYLNSPFFVIRSVFYLLVWSALAHRLYHYSIKQDSSPSEELTKKLKSVSAPGMLLFAVTTTFAAFDWLMSLEPHWYSTVFGVYVFSGGLVSGLALMTAVTSYVQSRGILKDSVTVEHYHDFGKLLFGFTIFWSYIGFAQYFLIWYGNIPEETFWYLKRWQGEWKLVSMILFFGHFVIPFIVLMFRATKRSTGSLIFMAVWIVAMHWFDHFWLVFPTLFPNGAQFSWIELATTLGIGGIFFWAFWNRFTDKPVVPVGDPKLEASIEHVNSY